MAHIRTTSPWFPQIAKSRASAPGRKSGCYGSRNLHYVGQHIRAEYEPSATVTAFPKSPFDDGRAQK